MSLGIEAIAKAPMSTMVNTITVTALLFRSANKIKPFIP
jgi:hypothetical protein